MFVRYRTVIRKNMLKYATYFLIYCSSLSKKGERWRFAHRYIYLMHYLFNQIIFERLEVPPW